MMQKWTKTPQPTATIGVLIFEQFSNLCLSNCLEPLRAANAVSGRAVFDWRILTLDGAPVQSSSGVEVLPQGALGAAGRFDYLFVLASYDHTHHDRAPVRRALRDAAQRTATMVAMDSAPWLLASAGLLSGRRATIHWDLLDSFAERFLDVRVERAHDLRDGPVITCAGAMSALDTVLTLIAARLGSSARLDIEDLFMQRDPPLTPSDDSRPPGDALVRRAVGHMRETVEQPLNLAGLARHLSCQPRTLDRRFRAALGAPPGTVYRHLRLAEARKMLEGTTLGIAEIAVRCGYESSAAMARAIRRHYGQTPTALRRRRALRA